MASLEDVAMVAVGQQKKGADFSPVAAEVSVAHNNESYLSGSNNGSFADRVA